ncbi:transcription factor bHLH48-like [Cynara cardunculus var. scolymus]|uniref:transcription factor bHLH48-like n=1 Tax=Cynara cardunculus var. scolymus TaxID=59895 RepID=UPI000D62902E|nr:transcription factor bHLH48-like [Cynara cardunculus var. scolymus]
MSGRSNQASIDNKFQCLNSSISMAVHDHHNAERENMLTTNSSSFNYHQSDLIWQSTKRSKYLVPDYDNETKTCRRRRKEKRSNNDEENKKKKMRDCKEEGQIGYIHVRARRGEATDSHSLAERFLSSKLASVNPILHEVGADFDAFMLKPQQGFCGWSRRRCCGSSLEKGGSVGEHDWNVDKE